jgi:hypothetical protein
MKILLLVCFVVALASASKYTKFSVYNSTNADCSGVPDFVSIDNGQLCAGGGVCSSNSRTDCVNTWDNPDKLIGTEDYGVGDDKCTGSIQSGTYFKPNACYNKGGTGQFHYLKKRCSNGLLISYSCSDSACTNCADPSASTEGCLNGVKVTCDGSSLTPLSVLLCVLATLFFLQ